MYVEHCLELLDRHRVEEARIVNTRIIDHGVDAAERVNRRIHNDFGAVFLGDGCITRHGLPAGVFDLVDDIFGRRGRRTRPVDADPVIGDDDPCAPRRQQHRVTPADAASRPRDDDYPIVKAQLRHQPAGASNRTGTDVGDRKA